MRWQARGVETKSSPEQFSFSLAGHVVEKRTLDPICRLAPRWTGMMGRCDSFGKG
jgi:hypothetical protein